MRKLRLSWRKKAKFETLKRFGGPKTYFTGLRNHCFNQRKEYQLVITKKYNEHNKELTEIVVGE